MKKWLITIVGLTFAGVAVYMTLDDFWISDEEKCEQRGVAYYKESGSYPTLSDGRSADKIVEERCAKTTTAF